MNKSPFSGTRKLTERVKTAKRRKTSSNRWLKRQLNDPYVHQAKKDGYRSRAAYKLLEMDEKFHFLKAGKHVIDLGAAPGGWTQVAVAATRSTPEDCRVVAVDILPMDALAGAQVMHLDFTKDEAPDAIRALMPKGADIVLSDMAPNTMGHAATDHLRIMALLELAYPFACEVLRPGGVFIAKVFQGSGSGELLSQMKKDFDVVKHAKPKSSRADSSEMYVVASGFRGSNR